MSVMVPQLWLPGAAVPPLELSASEVDLFRFSAMTWNAHRIHYDAAFAASEGLPGAVVQAHLHGAWFARLARSIAGPAARLHELSWKNRAPVVAGEQVRMEGAVADVEAGDRTQLVELELRELGAGDAVRAEARATVAIPQEPSA